MKSKKAESRLQGRPATAVAVGRPAIVGAVREALKTHPPGELTFKQIADIAAVDQRLIRYYFGTLPDLLKATAIEITEELRARFASESMRAGSRTPEQRLRDRIMVFLDHFGDNPHYHRLVVDYLVDTPGPDGEAAVGRFRQSAVELRALMSDYTPERAISELESQLVHVCMAAMCEYLFSAEAIFSALFGLDVRSDVFRNKFCDFVTSLVVGALDAGTLGTSEGTKVAAARSKMRIGR